MFLLKRRRAAPVLLGLGGVLAALSAGCGSSSTSATARVRGADFSVNGATTGVLVNLTAVGGDLTFGQSSPYNFVGQGISTFSFTSSGQAATTTVAGTATSTVFPPNAKLQLNNGSYYTAYLIGRVDVQPLTVTKTDPRFLQTVVTGDKGAAANYAASGGTGPGTAVMAGYSDPPAGQANIRILNGAPDAGPVDVLIGGKVVFPGVTYPAIPAGIANQAVAAVTPATIYAAQPSGTLSVQVNAAGTATVLVPATPLSVGSGGVYTVVVTETATTPTYGLSLESDD